MIEFARKLNDPNVDGADEADEADKTWKMMELNKFIVEFGYFGVDFS